MGGGACVVSLVLGGAYVVVGGSCVVVGGEYVVVGGEYVVVGGSISWLLRPRTLRALWKRMVIIGALLGTRRSPTETLGAYCKRLAGELPGERHGDGVHRDWLMTRERAVEDLQVIGTLSGKAAFSPKGLLPAEVTRWRRAWRGLVRLMPRLLMRRLARSQT